MLLDQHKYLDSFLMSIVVLLASGSAVSSSDDVKEANSRDLGLNKQLLEKICENSKKVIRGHSFLQFA